MAQAEREDARGRASVELAQQISRSRVPKDARDDRNVVLENPSRHRGY